MQQSIHDIAIVGGGLAGLSLAIQAADKDYDVILFEKEVYPFQKVCGEYISNESRAFIESLGISLNDFQVPEIDELDISDAKGNLFSFDLPLGGFGISRYKLDDALYKIALQKGVKVFTATKVNDIKFEDEKFIIQTNDEIFYSKIAAGSFGKRSNLDVKWKRRFTLQKNNSLNNFIAVKYHVEFELSENLISLHNFKNGYCGISNIEDGKCCVCYLTTAENLKANNNSISEMEKNVLSQNPYLQRIFSEAKFLYQYPLTISQISFEKKLQVEEHVLMLGDAAGLITPLCGNGMSMALHSSKIAFKNINDFLQNKISRKQLEENYTKEWNQNFSKRLQTGRFVQKLFGGEKSTSVFLKTMKALPFIAKQIIKSTHGKTF